MPEVIYNLEKVPNDIWKKKTVFLIGPSSRDQTAVKSYREEFIQHLTKVEEETNTEYVVFNPESPNWKDGKPSEFAKWELERLEQSSVIVTALNMDEDKLSGLNTRTEIGMLMATRRNLILWRPNTSYQTGYICGRFLERPYLVATNDLRDSARLVPLIYQRNADNIEVREGKFSSVEVRPDGCDYYFLETTLRKVEEENTNGAIYVYLPLFDTYGYSGVVEKLGGYRPFVQSEKYNILYKWNNIDYPCRVPEPGSSFSGAFGIFLSPDEKQCLLIYETKFGRARWGFVGGSIDRCELDIEAFEKEIKTETGVDFRINPNLDPPTSPLGLFCDGCVMCKGFDLDSRLVVYCNYIQFIVMWQFPFLIKKNRS